MSSPLELPRRRRIVAFTANPASDGEILPVFADFPADLAEEGALGELIEVASLKAGVAFEDYLKIIVAARPSEWEPNLPLGGKKARNWKTDYGVTAGQLWARAKTNVLVNADLRRMGFKFAALTMAAAVRATLVRQRARFGRRKMPDATVISEVESLRQAVRGIAARK